MMKAENVVVANLVTWTECQRAIDSIENDYNNVVGGRESFFSGYETKLKVAAENKIAAIKRKQEKLNNTEDE
jgi:hypothetical protein